MGWTCEEMRAVDRRAIEDFAVPGIVLMENAGRGAAEVLLSLGVSGRIDICCGKGNNGGDGFVMARHLAYAGVDVRVLLFANPADLRGDASLAFESIRRSRIALEIRQEIRAGDLASADWVVDALFGSGLRGPLRPPFGDIVAAIQLSGARILAVDIPSGLDADTGEPLGIAIRADHTVTFVGPKRGFLRPEARRWVGIFHVVAIGAPQEALSPPLDESPGAH